MITALATSQISQKKPLSVMCEVNLSNKYGPSMCIGQWCICPSLLDPHQNWGENMYIWGNGFHTRLLSWLSNWGGGKAHVTTELSVEACSLSSVSQASDKQKDRCPWLIHTTFHKWHHAHNDGTTYALLGESYTIDEQK
jgi:hypothetical protein